MDGIKELLAELDDKDAEIQKLREYYGASEAAWNVVTDFFSDGKEGHAIHERLCKAVEALNDGQE